MTDTMHTKEEARARDSAGHGDHRAKPIRRKRRSLRVALITLGSIFCLVIVTAIGSYAYFNHAISNIQRLSVTGLTAAVTPSTLDGQTFLITSYPEGPTGTAAQQTQSGYSNLVMLLHTNANGMGGGAVTIPGSLRVDVPGKGNEPLWDAMQKTGNPSLLVKTITELTKVPINHYAQIDFSHISGLVNAIGGVDVTVPTATKGFGYSFVKGVNHLNGVTAIYYGRDPTLKGQDRLLRQENLVRAVFTKIASDHLLSNPVADVHVVNAITSMLAVDSNFTNSDIESLIGQFGKLAADTGTFVTAPTETVGANLVPNAALDAQLWTAVKHDSIAAFAKKYPSTVTPQAAP
jgi:LCP family protein required for cell wall assembly